MRCKACNQLLSDYEATRKTKEAEFIDLCNTCFKMSHLEEEYFTRLDLVSEADIDYTIGSSYNFEENNDAA